MRALASAGDAAACGRLNANLSSALLNARGVWAAFCPIAGEPDPRPSLPRRASLEWAFPRVAGDALEFRVPQDPSSADAFEVGSWGVLEPSLGARAVAPGDIAGFLVPGLAFDREGARMGRGKGFYDRCLALSEGFRIGVAFASQIADSPLPMEAHDVRMDAVVTENGIIWAGEKRP